MKILQVLGCVGLLLVCHDILVHATIHDALDVNEGTHTPCAEAALYRDEPTTMFHVSEKSRTFKCVFTRFNGKHMLEQADPDFLTRVTYPNRSAVVRRCT